MKANEQGKQANWIFIAILIIAVPLLFAILYAINSDTRRNEIQLLSKKDTSETNIKKKTETIKTDTIKKENK